MDDDGRKIDAWAIETATAWLPERLQLIVMPTEQCNFRCTYCYEDFTLGRMPGWVVEALKSLVSRRTGDLRLLHLSWFGGEPLLARDIVVDLSAHAKAVCNAAGVKYVADMTTNGYNLTPAMLDTLVHCGVSQYQISLDGPPAWHNATRIRADGGATFARIWQNLIDIRHSPHELRVIVRLHLTRDNYESMMEFAPELRRELLVDPRFTVFVKPVERLGGPNDAALPVLPHAQAQPLVRRLYELLDAGGAENFDSGEVCYAAQANSLVVRADGTIAKCTVAFDNPANQVGRLRSDGSMALDLNRLAPWLRGWGTSDRAALSCPLQDMSVRDERFDSGGTPVVVPARPIKLLSITPMQ